MAYFNICPKCGCTLDPGEKCDCEKIIEEQHEKNKAFYDKNLTICNDDGQLTFMFEVQKGIGA